MASDVHLCEVCSQPSEQHPAACGRYDADNDQDCRHFPPLCCPGCPCGSYEEAHCSCSPDPDTGADYQDDGTPCPHG